VLALTTGGTLAGVLGALVAVPLAAMVGATLSYLRAPASSTEETATPTTA